MNYKNYDGTLICKLPKDDEIDLQSMEDIAKHTKNTWQKDRGYEETLANTLQGKKAEFVVEKILEEHSSHKYLPYDSFRNDDYKKHAPFDGLIYSKTIDESLLKDAIDKILLDVQKNPNGSIDVSTRNYLESNKIYTVEIKSSNLVNPRDYAKMTNKGKDNRTDDDYRSLCSHILSFYDFFVYPHFTRDASEIDNFYKYAKFVETNHPQEFENLDTQTFLKKLIECEFDNACDIYLRVFIDNITNEVVVPGYITKPSFFREPCIAKMPSSKSMKAIYYMYRMRYRKQILSIDSDPDLNQWNSEELKETLFGAINPVCPTCKKELLCYRESKTRFKYLYMCDSCNSPQKWVELYNMHENMRPRW